MIAQDRFSQRRPGLLVFLDRAADGAGRRVRPRRRVRRLDRRGSARDERGRHGAGAREPRASTRASARWPSRDAIDFRLERGAPPRADRPQRRRQDDLRQSRDRRAAAERAATSCSTAPTSRHLPQAARVKRGLVRTFQITALFRGLTVLENVTLAVCRAARRRRRHVPAGRQPPRGDRGSLSPCSNGWGSRTRRCGRSTRAGLWPPAPGRDRRGARPRSPRCCCSTSRRPACRRAKAAAIIEVVERAAGRHRAADHRARYGPGLPAGAAHHRAGAGRVLVEGRPTRSPPIRACAKSISASGAPMS